MIKQKSRASRKMSPPKVKRTRAVRPAIKGLNVKLLRKVQKHILEEPRRLRMEVWSARDADAPCGTAACIAGWACRLSGFTRYRNTDNYAEKAIELLKIPGGSYWGSPGNKTAHGLFVRGGWPSQFFRASMNAVTSEERAAITAQRIDHFIKTGE